MKIQSSLVLIVGMSLASTAFLQAATTKLNTNGTWAIDTSTTTAGTIDYLAVTGNSTRTGKITTNDLKTDFLNVTNECNIHSVTIGRGNGHLSYNTAIGYAVLDGVSATGNEVTGVGSYALQINSSGSNNTAVGHAAMQYNTTGANNTATGRYVLRYNTAGHSNTASGVNSMLANTSGFSNSALGLDSLGNNILGNENTAIGVAALRDNTASQNTGVGMAAFHNNTVGSSNTAIGHHAGAWMGNGATPLTTSYNSIYIGASCRGMSNADNNSIVIGAGALGEGANTTVIGTSSTVSTRLYGKTTTDSLQVNGNTVLSGTVVLAQAQGDISMGAYQ